MIRKLMAGSALLALMTAGSFGIAQAQTEQQQPAAAEQPATDPAAPAADPVPPAGQDPAAQDPAAAGQDAAAGTEAEEPKTEISAAGSPTLTPDQPTIATAFIGRSVFSSENPDSDNIGEVNDLIIGSDGMITHAVVGVGGFLGIGEKDVSVPFDQLQVVQMEDGEVRLIYAATREQLEAAEAFDRTAFDPEERAEEQQEAAETNVDADTDTTMATGEVATAPGAVTTEPATTDAEQPAGEAEVAETEQPAGEAEVAETEQQPAAETETAAGTDAATTPVVAGEGGFVAFSADQVRATTMIGKEVYGAENEPIGEVSDLILAEDGKTRAALIDVGGFLGIGEKRVAIPFSEIKMTQPEEMAAAGTDPAAPAEGTDPAAPAAETADPNAPAATATTDPAAPAGAEVAATAEPRLTVAMTREQLEQLPEWEEPAEQTATAEQPAAGTADPNAPAATDPNAPAGTETAATDPNAAAGAEGQYQPVTQDLTAENLLGSTVYGANNESLGDVGDVVFDPNGEIQAVVVDVGGFLGVGEKPVAVQFDSLNVQKNGDGDIRLMMNATQEQLENAPEYDAEAAAEGQPQPTVQ